MANLAPLTPPTGHPSLLPRQGWPTRRWSAAWTGSTGCRGPTAAQRNCTRSWWRAGGRSPRSGPRLIFCRALSMTSSLPRRDNTRNSLDPRKRKRFLLAQKWERNVPTPRRETWKGNEDVQQQAFFLVVVWFFGGFFFQACFEWTLFFFCCYFFFFSSPIQATQNIWQTYESNQRRIDGELGEAAGPRCRRWNLPGARLEVARGKAWGSAEAATGTAAPPASRMVQKPPLRRRATYLHFLFLFSFKPGLLQRNGPCHT